ncbi:MAG: Smr/MutS family protein [Gemmatimonadota bacterium]
MGGLWAEAGAETSWGPVAVRWAYADLIEMASRKKRKKTGKGPPAQPELTGIALLLVESPVEKLDLHGMNARQAETRVQLFFQRHTASSPGRVVHVITGKGTRSEGAAVLPGLVREMLQDDLSRMVSEWAGLHGGGGFAVRVAGG